MSDAVTAAGRLATSGIPGRAGASRGGQRVSRSAFRFSRASEKGNEITTDEAGRTAGPLPFDISKAHQARMYDYLLGGCFP